jgi:membrane protease YdiL (CAAX protease family)
MEESKTAFKSWDHRVALILLIVPVVLMVWVYYGKQAHFEWLFGQVRDGWGHDFYSVIYEYLAAFFLMFVVPSLAVKIVFRRSLREFGFRLGDVRCGFRLVAVMLPFLLLAAYVGSLDPAIQAEYSPAKSAMWDVPVFLVVGTAYLFYYLGWEFLFRGFMLFGLEERYGVLLAILVQMIPSVVVHIGKPAVESFAAIAAGLIFGYVAFRTRSILYPFLLHAAVGLGTDVFVALQLMK